MCPSLFLPNEPADVLSLPSRLISKSLNGDVVQDQVSISLRKSFELAGAVYLRTEFESPLIRHEEPGGHAIFLAENV